MDPLSIVGSSFAIAGAVAKASIAILEFSNQAKDASEDLLGVSRELQALSAILDPLARNISHAPSGSVPASLSQQLGSSLDGCARVVSQIDITIEKYQKDGAWTRTKWVMYGRGDMEKLRGSLEAFKMALSLGLHVISLSVADNIKDKADAIRSDTQALRHDAAAIQVNTEEILARVMSLRNGARTGGTRTRQWVESMAVLSSYAESSYQDTIVDLGEDKDITADDSGSSEETASEGDAVLDTVPEFGHLELLDDEEQESRIRRASGSGGHGGIAALDSIPESDRLEFSDEKQWAREVRAGFRSNGDHTRAAPSSSAKLPVSQAHIGTNSPFGVTARTTLRRGRPRLVETHERSRSRSRERQERSRSRSRERQRRAPTFSGTARRPNITGELDVVVVLDIGETSAAVAWVSRKTRAKTICEWPGGRGARVPIRVVCDEKKNALRWGFQCGESTGQHRFLFLGMLYAHVRKSIISTLGLELSDWGKMGVEFHFTTPDALRDLAPHEPFQRTTRFKDEIRKLGIGTGGPRHCAVLSLTETEAAVMGTFLQPPGPTYQPSFMLKISTTHVAILIVTDRSSKIRRINASYPISMPKLSTHIEGLVSTWLKEDDPEFSDSLGPSGLGHIVQGRGYSDMMDFLHGYSPLRESYRLRFDGLPESTRHRAFDIKDGTIELLRTHVEHIFDSLVDEISRRLIDALVDRRINLKAAGGVRRIATPETADTPKYLAERITKALRQKSDILDAALRAASPRSSKVALNTALDKRITLRNTSGRIQPITTSLDPALATLEGLLLHRDAWYSTLGLRMECDGPRYPRLYATAGTYIHNRPSRDEDFPPVVERTDESKTDPWPHPMALIKQNWRVSVSRFRRDGIRALSFHLNYTLDDEWRQTDPWEAGKLKRLCTVCWKLMPWEFQEHTWKREWWRRDVKQWTLEFTIQFSMLQPFKSEPMFKLNLPHRPPRLPFSVEWHSEPPFLITDMGPSGGVFQRKPRRVILSLD